MSVLRCIRMQSIKMILKNLFTGQQWRNRLRLMDMGREEEKVRCMERVTWKFALPYVEQIAKGNLLYGSGNSNRGSVSTQRGGMGREMGENGFFKSINFLLKDSCFTEFCCFLSNLNMNQPQVYIYSLPFEPPSRLPPHPTPPG